MANQRILEILRKPNKRKIDEKINNILINNKKLKNILENGFNEKNKKIILELANSNYISKIKILGHFINKNSNHLFYPCMGLYEKGWFNFPGLSKLTALDILSQEYFEKTYRGIAESKYIDFKTINCAFWNLKQEDVDPFDILIDKNGITPYKESLWPYDNQIEVEGFGLDGKICSNAKFYITKSIGSKSSSNFADINCSTETQGFFQLSMFSLDDKTEDVVREIIIRNKDGGFIFPKNLKEIIDGLVGKVKDYRDDIWKDTTLQMKKGGIVISIHPESHVITKYGFESLEIPKKINDIIISDTNLLEKIDDKYIYNNLDINKKNYIAGFKGIKNPILMFRKLF